MYLLMYLFVYLLIYLFMYMIAYHCIFVREAFRRNIPCEADHMKR